MCYEKQELLFVCSRGKSKFSLKTSSCFLFLYPAWTCWYGYEYNASLKFLLDQCTSTCDTNMVSCRVYIKLEAIYHCQVIELS